MKYFRKYGLAGMFSAFRLLLKENAELRRRLRRLESPPLNRSNSVEVKLPQSSGDDAPQKKLTMADIINEAKRRHYEDQDEAEKHQQRVEEHFERRLSRLKLSPASARRLAEKVGR